METKPGPAGGRWALARTVLVHLGLWLGFAALLLLPEGGRTDAPPLWPNRVLYVLELFVLAAPPVYVHFWLFERYYLRGRRLLHLALLCATILGWAVAFGPISRLWSGMSAGLVPRLSVIIILVVLSAAFRLLAIVGRQRALIEETRARQLQAELELLKAQVHPHFLFNTLNNLFGLARKGDPAAADGIARLAHLLRYAIYESSADRVDLEREVEQIRRLVDLERLRFSPDDDIEVTLAVGDDLSGARVPPMLLVPLVENAFKHGIRRSAPSFVRVALSATNGTVHFTVENSLHGQRAVVGEQAGGGIGLQNVRRRLELMCPGAYDLRVGASDGVFRAELSLAATSTGGAR